MSETIKAICKEIMRLRELGQKRDARSMVIENNIDGMDILFTIHEDERREPTIEEWMSITTLMDSVRDEMRDENLSLKRQLKQGA